MGFNGNTNDAINESFTDDSLGQTSYRTVTEIRNSSGVPIDPATEDKQDALITDLQSVIANGSVQTPTGKLVRVQIGPGDVISNVPVVIEFDHHQVHEGEAFSSEYYSANPATIAFSITVPAFDNTIRGPHLVVEAECYEGSGMISIGEGVTFTGGTPMLVYNRNRNVLTAASTTINSGVTITGAGTLLPYTMFFASGKESRTSSETRAMAEVVLKSNTIYRVSIEEIVAMTRMIVRFNWYEDLGV